MQWGAAAPYDDSIMNTYPSPDALKQQASFRTGRRYFEYQKNTQTSNITFTPEYYQNAYVPTLNVQRRYYQTLSEQPPVRQRPDFNYGKQDSELPSAEELPKPSARDPNYFQGAPTLDDRLSLALEEKHRAEDLKHRNFEALRLQMNDNDRKRKVLQLERERQTAMRMQELREMETEQQIERTRQLSRSLQYRSTLDLQAQLKTQLREGGRKGDVSPPQETPFSPLIRSNFILPRNKDHLAVDLAPLPEFPQTRYTARHPKRIPTNPITFSSSPPRNPLPEDLKPDIARFFGVDEEERKEQRRTLPRNMSDYGSMVMRPADKSPFAEPVLGKRAGLNYSDTRHLII